NRVMHIMAVVQLRHDTPGRAYYRRRLAEGKTPMQACARSNATSRTWSTSGWSRTPNELAPARRAREDNRERLCNPARTAQSRQPPLRTSHNPDPPLASVEQISPQPLDLEGSQMRMFRWVRGPGGLGSGSARTPGFPISSAAAGFTPWGFTRIPTVEGRSSR